MSYGKSLALSKATFITPPEPNQKKKDCNGPKKQQRRKRRRKGTIYDAVAGRMNSHGFIPSKPYASKYRDTASSSSRPVPPDEALYRRKGMPDLYEETDRMRLAPDIPLPDSALLEAIHAYTADFYEQTTKSHGRGYSYSMTGTALLGMGVLLEELAKESLGETGDLVLVEGEPVGRKRANSLSGTQVSSGDDLDKIVKRQKRTKKRRLARQTITTDMDTKVEN
ncbi:hypothetical protein P175DRAFT_0520141 [Aspergillus ochraceoroseus IBT 24754]|uniref:Uncharacterized protein n=1 Tax=Aspergillus ochraceoroseus IBT 24754 TaxID=1392256 RepID=A0A2T5M6N6_9EURO|nr:uncharacterized protein P175DRAFT_0520141 [Aspergillus ochraceoroseus IBT 24754]PTU24192.1 hypothetical protein P175DRAFT_0520141 [Aspergillus ochraceoroseus IBT 24754]